MKQEIYNTINSKDIEEKLKKSKLKKLRIEAFDRAFHHDKIIYRNNIWKIGVITN